jgi:peroxiredoxin
LLDREQKAGRFGLGNGIDVLRRLHILLIVLGGFSATPAASAQVLRPAQCKQPSFLGRPEQSPPKTKEGPRVLSEYPLSWQVGKLFPDFSFTDLAGKHRTLSDFRGKYVLLDFWGTWCAPCVAEIPNLKETYERYRGRGFEIIGLDIGEPVEPLKAFATKREMTWPLATSESIEDLISDFDIWRLPTTVLLGPKGEILSVGRHSELPVRGKGLFETLEKLLPKEAS